MEWPQRFIQHELLRMCLNNFRHHLSTTLMPQTFEGFNDLCPKAHDVEIQLNKQKKGFKESGEEPNRLLSDGDNAKGKRILQLWLIIG